MGGGGKADVEHLMNFSILALEFVHEFKLLI